MITDHPQTPFPAIRYPIEGMVRSQKRSTVPQRELKYEGLIGELGLGVIFQRLNWGDAIQFYVIAHHWSKRSINVMSTLRLQHWETQDHYVSALIKAGMPCSEAAYLNMMIEEEGIRRCVNPQTFGLIPC